MRVYKLSGVPRNPEEAARRGEEDVFMRCIGRGEQDRKNILSGKSSEGRIIGLLESREEIYSITPSEGLSDYVISSGLWKGKKTAIFFLDVIKGYLASPYVIDKFGSRDAGYMQRDKFIDALRGQDADAAYYFDTNALNDDHYIATIYAAQQLCGAYKGLRRREFKRQAHDAFFQSRNRIGSKTGNDRYSEARAFKSKLRKMLEIASGDKPHRWYMPDHRDYQGRVVIYDTTKTSRRIIENIVLSALPYAEVCLADSRERLLEGISAGPNSLIISEGVFSEDGVENSQNGPLVSDLVSRVRVLDSNTPIIFFSAYEHNPAEISAANKIHAPVELIRKTADSSGVLQQSITRYQEYWSDN